MASSNVIKTIGYDCLHPETEMDIVASNMVEECPQIKSKLFESFVNIQLIQERIFEQIQIKHCLITSISLTMHCGLFSHMSIIDKGLSKNILQISRESCENIHKNGNYNYAGHIISDLRPNSSRNVDIVEFGSIDNQGNCKGVDVVTDHGTHKNVVVITTIDIELSDYTSVYNSQKNEIVLEDGSVCKLEEERCFHPRRGLAIWNNEILDNCNQNSRDILFQGKAKILSENKPENHSTIQPGDVITINNQQNVFALQVKAHAHLCFQPVLTTEVDRILIVTENPSYRFYFKKSTEMLTRNIDLSIHINTKIANLAFSARTDIQKLYNEIHSATCEINRDIIINRLAEARNKEQQYGHLLTGAKGFLNKLAGDVFISIKCVPIPVTLRETDRCYKNLPIYVNEQPRFLETEGYTIVEHGKETPCSRIGSSTFLINQQWLTNNKHINLANKPTILKPRSYVKQINFAAVNNYVTAGLYSKAQIKNFMDFLVYPQKIEIAQERINSRIISNKEINDIKINIETLFTKEDLSKFKTTFISDVEAKILLFGNWTGAILGIIIIIQTLRYLVSTLINLQFLRAALGNGFHLLAAVLTSLTNYTIRNNIQRENAIGNEVENHEIQEVRRNAPTLEEA